MATETKTTGPKVAIRASHQTSGPRGICWIDPVDWEPTKPAEFAAEEYVIDDGSVWGDEEEEAGLICLDLLSPGDFSEVTIDRIRWARSNICGFEVLADAVAIASDLESR